MVKGSGLKAGFRGVFRVLAGFKARFRGLGREDLNCFQVTHCRAIS